MPVLDKKLQKYLFCLYMFSVSVFAAYRRAVRVCCRSEMEKVSVEIHTELKPMRCENKFGVVEIPNGCIVFMIK